MKQLLVFLIFLFPSFLFAQLRGEYIFWGGEFTITYTFQKNGKFHYNDANDISGLWGKGNYNLKGDTLTLNFETYLDSSEFYCSKILVEKDNIVNDSIKIIATVFDCQLNDTVNFAKIQVYDSSASKIILEKPLDITEVCTFQIATRHNFPRVLAFDSHYYAKEVQVNTDSANFFKIDFFLLQSYRDLIPEGQVERCLIKKTGPNTISLGSVDSESTGRPTPYLRIRKRWSRQKIRKKLDAIYYKFFEKEYKEFNY